MRILGLVFAGSATPQHATMSAFLGDVLGLPRLSGAGSGAAMFGLPDGSRLAVAEEREPGTGTSRTIGLEVADVAAAARELAAAGLDVGDVQANDDYRYVHLVAPDGRLWELVERIDPASLELARLLAALTPVRRPGAVVVASVPAGLPDGLPVLASVQADEGTSVVVDRAAAARAGLDVGSPLAWITLRVRAEPSGVGLTARISAALAAEGIGTAVLAGGVHDHLLVPLGSADAAMRALAALGGG
jgi:hypothetical protein